jgi:hypothetical protein
MLDTLLSGLLAWISSLPPFAALSGTGSLALLGSGFIAVGIGLRKLIGNRD